MGCRGCRCKQQLLLQLPVLVPGVCSSIPCLPQDEVHCVPYSLNVYLGKASKPGLGRSWLGKSALLTRVSQAGVGGGKEGEVLDAELWQQPWESRERGEEDGGHPELGEGAGEGPCTCLTMYYSYSFQMCF